MTPEGWRAISIGEFAEVRTGGTPLRDRPDFWNGDVPWMSSGEVNKRFVWETDEKITNAALSASNARWLPAESVMMALNGQGKTRGMVALLKAPATCNQSLAAILPSPAGVPAFVFHALDSKYEAIRAITGDGGRNGLNLELVRGIVLQLPPVGEQRKIAAILSSVDDTIEATQAVIDQLGVVKHAMMAELLSRGISGRHTHFKQTEIGEVPESWQVLRLGELVRMTSGGTPSRDRPEYWNGGIPWVKTGEINYGEVAATEETISEAGAANSSARVVPRGSLLMAMYGQGATRGRVALLGIDAALNQACLALLEGPRTSNGFLFHVLASRYESLRAIGNEGSQKNLSATLVKEVQVPVPTLDEQREIEAVLSSIGDRVALEQQVSEHLHAVKRALMSVLLTGEVRVKPDEDAT